jgi:hypothetical protein
MYWASGNGEGTGCNLLTTRSLARSMFMAIL